MNLKEQVKMLALQHLQQHPLKEMLLIQLEIYLEKVPTHKLHKQLEALKESLDEILHESQKQ